MIGRRGFGLAAVAAAALVLCGCKADSTPDDYRYKMTVEVDTPQGVKTASAVREIRFNTRFNGGFYGSVKGEAVVVDLPGGKTLFALLTGAHGNVDYAGQDIALLFNEVDRNSIQVWPRPLYPNPNAHEDYKRSHDLSYPMLVTFKDMADPKSVEQVKPDALEQVFGPGVKLKRITVAKTNEAVTMVIGKRLASLGIEKGHSLDRMADPEEPLIENPTLSQKLGFSSFIRGQR